MNHVLRNADFPTLGNIFPTLGTYWPFTFPPEETPQWNAELQSRRSPIQCFAGEPLIAEPSHGCKLRQYLNYFVHESRGQKMRNKKSRQNHFRGPHRYSS
jgi:hypothetical protein